MFDKIFEKIFTYHRGKAVGVILGIIFGVLVISIGLLETLFITACIYAGYIIGKRLDEKDGFPDIVDKLFRDRD